jgi:soluble lytic murein transglycosylase-like protein
LIVIQDIAQNTDLLVAAARRTAGAHFLDEALVCAVVEQESHWNPWAIRYEPAFFTRYIGPHIEQFTATEAKARAFSWGLMQVMGQTARELRYSGPFAQLCVPEMGLEWGCRRLQRALDHSAGNIHTALQAYNGGANPHYAGEVLARMDKYKTTHMEGAR